MKALALSTLVLALLIAAVATGCGQLEMSPPPLASSSSHGSPAATLAPYAVSLDLSHGDTLVWDLGAFQTRACNLTAEGDDIGADLDAGEQEVTVVSPTTFVLACDDGFHTDSAGVAVDCGFGVQCKPGSTR